VNGTQEDELSRHYRIIGFQFRRAQVKDGCRDRGVDEHATRLAQAFQNYILKYSQIDPSLTGSWWNLCCTAGRSYQFKILVSSILRFLITQWWRTIYPLKDLVKNPHIYQRHSISFGFKSKCPPEAKRVLSGARVNLPDRLSRTARSRWYTYSVTHVHLGPSKRQPLAFWSEHGSDPR